MYIYKGYEFELESEGWTYIAVRLTRPGRNWLQRKLGMKTLVRVSATKSNGFPERLFASEISLMTPADYHRLVCDPAIAYWEKLQQVRTAWESQV
jgi:hypothetical protein